MPTEFIDPEQLLDKMGEHLVHYQYNPNRCVCGWYCFTYAHCTHVYKKLDKKCGGTNSKTGKLVFCKTPAPTHVITNAKLKPQYVCHDSHCWSRVVPQPIHMPNLFDLDPDFQVPAPQGWSLFEGGAPRQPSVDRMTPGLGRAAGQSTRGNSPAGSVHTMKTEEPSTPRGHARGQSLGPPSHASSISRSRSISPGATSASGSISGGRSRQPTPQPARQQQQGGSPRSQAPARKGVGATPPPAAGNRRAAPGGAAGASVGRGVR